MVKRSVRLWLPVCALSLATAALIVNTRRGTSPTGRSAPASSAAPPSERGAEAPIELRLAVLEALNAASATQAGASWQSIGPSPLVYRGQLPAVGRIISVGLHPVRPDTYFVGTNNGGVWKTTDSGAHWRPVTDSHCSMTIGALAVDPVNPQIVYAGTGTIGGGVPGCGLLRSEDGGETWVRLGSPDWRAASSMALRIVIDRRTAGGSRGTVLFVAAYRDGLLRSTDGGQTTRVVLGGPTETVSDVAIDQANPSKLFAIVTARNGSQFDIRIAKSTDGGDNWAVTTVATQQYPGGQIGIAPSDSRIVYAKIIGAGGWVGRFLRSSDGGDSWSLAAGVADAGSGGGGGPMVIAPTDPKTLFFGQVRLLKSTDGGDSWSEVVGSRTVHVDPHVLAFDNSGRLFNANDGGLHRSDDNGNSWVDMNGDLSITEFYEGIAFDRTRPNIIYGGSQDNGVNLFEGSTTWRTLLQCDAGQAIVDRTRPWSVFATCQWPIGIMRCDLTDTTSTCRNMMSGIDKSDRAEFINPPFAGSLADPGVFYFGSNRVYRTANSAETWSPTGPALDAGNYFVELAVSNQNANHLIASSIDRVTSVSRDGGASWVRAEGLVPFPAFFLRFDPVDDTIAYATQHDTRSQLYQSTDGGNHWRPITGNLPALMIYTLAVDVGGGTRVLYVGTEVGVYRSTNNGATWEPFSSGLPRVQVFAMAISPDQRTLVAATYGRGMFRIPLR